MELQRKLDAVGWKVCKVQDCNSRYEVDGLDDKGLKA